MDSVFGNTPNDVNVASTPVQSFIDATALGSPEQLQQMGRLSEYFSPKEFADFCAAFAKGVNYIYERYGTCPKGIILTDENASDVRYNVESQNIYMTRNFIGDMLSMTTVRQSKTDPYVLTKMQMAALYGVEEAFHHYEFSQHKNYYDRFLNDRTSPDGGPEYDDNPIEGDAKREVQAALIYFGFNKMPTVDEFKRDDANGGSWEALVKKSMSREESLERC